MGRSEVGINTKFGTHAWSVLVSLKEGLGPRVLSLGLGIKSHGITKCGTTGKSSTPPLWVLPSEFCCIFAALCFAPACAVDDEALCVSTAVGCRNQVCDQPRNITTNFFYSGNNLWPINTRIFVPDTIFLPF